MFTANRLDVLIWVLIYGGLLAAALGLAVQRGDAPLGWGMVVGGGVAMLLGAVLVVVRARLKPST